MLSPMKSFLLSNTPTVVKLFPTLQADWTVNLGDHAISIRIPRQLPGKPSQLLVLGERGVYCCLDTGQLRFMMKLEVSPSCIYPYGVVLPSSEGESEIICMHGQ